MDEHTPLTISIFAAALVALRLLELLIPMFERGARGHTRRNLSLAAFNGLAAIALAGLTVAATGFAASKGLGLLRLFEGPAWVGYVLGFVLLDLWHYSFHVLAHKLPVLWRFHVVHHHDESVQVTSALRFHVGEICIQHLLALPVYVLLGVSLGQIVLYEIVLVPVAMFHHANIRMPERLDRMLRWLIVTPRMHWVHHSRWQPETDSNYSAIFSIWDRLFRTFRLRRDPMTIDFGIDGYDQADHATLRGMLMTPFGPNKSEHGEAPPEEDLASSAGGSTEAAVTAHRRARPESPTTTLPACPRTDPA